MMLLSTPLHVLSYSACLCVFVCLGSSGSFVVCMVTAYSIYAVNNLAVVVIISTELICFLYSLNMTPTGSWFENGPTSDIDLFR